MLDSTGLKTKSQGAVSSGVALHVLSVNIQRRSHEVKSQKSGGSDLQNIYM